MLATRRTWTLWLEIVAVLALTKPWYGGSSVATIAFHALGFSDDSANLYLPTLLANAFAAALVFAVVRLNHEPVATLGITKPSSVDIVTGGLAMVIGVVGSRVGVDLLYSFLSSFYDKKYVDHLAAAGVSHFHFDDWSGFVSLLSLAVAIGFSEELVARGYLIPRLERLFHGTTSAVLASAVLFSLFHAYRGIFSMCSALIVGVIFGTAFA